MLYLILGTDKDGLDKVTLSITGKTPLSKIDTFSWNADLVRSLVESDSLFGGEGGDFIFDSVSENVDYFDDLLKMAPRMAESKKKFFISESILEEEDLELLKKAGAHVKDFREKKAKYSAKGWPAFSGNPFALADAVGKRSAKEAWIEFSRARFSGAEAEELHSRIWGKVRDMIASKNSTAIELGLHPFVYKKAKADLNNWSKEKLENFVQELLAIYHRSRTGSESLEVALERTLLSI